MLSCRLKKGAEANKRNYEIGSKELNIAMAVKTKRSGSMHMYVRSLNVAGVYRVLVRGQLIGQSKYLEKAVEIRNNWLTKFGYIIPD